MVIYLLFLFFSILREEVSRNGCFSVYIYAIIKVEMVERVERV